MKDPWGHTALVVEGGALRGVFSTGLLDAFLERRFNPFDFFIGVSSGASNLAAYLAGMISRNRRVYMDYSLRPEFINLSRFIRGGHLIDLDWLWEATIREIRLDLAAVYAHRKPFFVVTTDVQTGAALYHPTSADNLEHLLKASSAVPLLYRGYPQVGGRPMTDGGVADALPVEEAIRRGACRIMVVRSRKKAYVKERGPAEYLLRWSVRHHPLLRQAISRRVEVYNRSVTLIRNPPPGIAIVEVCPPEDFRVTRLGKDLKILQEGYEQGRSLAGEAMDRWEDHNRLPGTGI